MKPHIIASVEQSRRFCTGPQNSSAQQLSWHSTKVRAEAAWQAKSQITNMSTLPIEAVNWASAKEPPPSRALTLMGGRKIPNENWPKVIPARKAPIAWVWILLAVLLSYSFDLECLVERQGCTQNVVHVDRASDCTQPGFTPPTIFVAVLPSTPSIRIPAPRVVALGSQCWTPMDSPPQTSRSVPLGLRAPPLA